jgi:PAS domain S-box-containing protein
LTAALADLRPLGPLDERLGPALDAAARACGASAWALVEVNGNGGLLAHRLRLCGGAWSAEAGAPAGLDTPAALEALLRAAAEGGPRGRTLAAPGGGALWACALPVQPLLWTGPDCGVLLVDPVEPLSAEGCAQLCAALSDDRQRALERAAFVALRDAREPIELADREVRLIWGNAAWERLTGWDLDEVRGKFLSFLRDPTISMHDPAYYRHTERVMDERGAWVGFVGSRAKDGRRLSQEVSVSRFGGAHERFTGNFAVRRDLAGQEAREEALALFQLELRALLLSLPVPVLVVRGAEVIFCNARAADLLDRGQDRLIGARINALVHPGDRHLLTGVLGGGQADLRLLRGDGRPRLAELVTAGTVSFGGAPAQVLLLRDRTEVRVGQEKELLGERVAAVRSLAASLRNELSSPLSVLLHHLGATLSEGEGMSPAVRRGVEEALGAGRRIEAVTDSLRGISRLRERGDQAPAEVDAVVGAALKLLGGELRHLAQVELTGEPGLAVRMAEADLLQVIVQLLQNAADALPPSGYSFNHVRVHRRRADEMIELVVEDNGPGLPPGFAERAFEPFVTTRAEQEGLGLPVCRVLVLGASGEISLGAAPSGGTRAVVRVPAQPAPQPAAPARGPGARVVVVDDEPALGRSIQRMLREHQVEVFTSSPDALQRLGEEPLPDVILCDLMMPELSGPALHAAVQRLRPELEARFLFITGGVFTDEGRGFVRAMDGRVVDKPFTAAALRAQISAVLERNRAPALA